MEIKTPTDENEVSKSLSVVAIINPSLHKIMLPLLSFAVDPVRRFTEVKHIDNKDTLKKLFGSGINPKFRKYFSEVNQLTCLIGNTRESVPHIVDLCKKYGFGLCDLTLANDTKCQSAPGYKDAIWITFQAAGPLSRRILADLWILEFRNYHEDKPVKLGHITMLHAYSEDPPITEVDIINDPGMKICSKCNTIDAKNRCSRCTLVRYCNAECQSANWSSHKDDCKKWLKYKFDLKEFNLPTTC